MLPNLICINQNYFYRIIKRLMESQKENVGLISREGEIEGKKTVYKRWAKVLVVGQSVTDE